MNREQRGDEISYAEAQPGDLILYEGHVGIYMGDGKIINAMNEAQGIGSLQCDIYEYCGSFEEYCRSCSD